MPQRIFYGPNDIDAIRKIAVDSQKITIAEGKVLVVFADGTAKVQLSGASTSVTAETTQNSEVLPGDFVFLIRSIITSRWFILASANIQNITGVLGGASGGTISGAASPVTAPNTLTVLSDEDMLIAQWTPSGVQSGVVYQLSISDDSIGTGEVLVLVPGGEYTLPAPTGTTKYFKVRSVDEEWNTSGWTAIVSATSLSTNSIQIESLGRREKETGEFSPSTFALLKIKINNFIGKIIHANTDNRTYTLPDNDGTIALTTDQPDLIQIEMFARRPQIVTSSGGSANLSDAVILDPTSDTRNTIFPSSDWIGLLVKGASSGVKDIQRWLKSDGTVFGKVNKDGQIVFENGSVGQIIARGTGTQRGVYYADNAGGHGSLIQFADADIGQYEFGMTADANLAFYMYSSVTGWTHMTVYPSNKQFDFRGASFTFINANSYTTPDASALAQFESTAQGFLMPRMTTTQRNAIASPADGLMIYNVTTHRFNIYENGSWFEEATTSDPPDLIQSETFARRQLTSMINLANQVLGILRLKLGGTGADLSATGGANQFVKQSSSGAAFTVGAISDADVPDALTINGGTINNTTIGATTPASGHFATDLLLYISGVFGSFTHANTTGRTYTFKDADGTVAFTTDQPDILQNEVFN